MKVKFFTLGCKVNQYETELIKEIFQKEGFEVSQKEADFCVVNTCSVTKEADRKSYETVLKVKKEFPFSKIIVCGCFVNHNRKKLENLNLDYLFSQEEKIVQINKIFNRSIENIIDLKVKSFSNQRAFIKIQDGCDMFCSFCKVPFLRGSPKSKNKEIIFEEINSLSIFHPEIVLCGINLGLYGKNLYNNYNLSFLLEDIFKKCNFKRIRLSSLEPLHLDNNLIGIFLKNISDGKNIFGGKLCPHLHFPFQSGCSKILQMMNKKETKEIYLEKVRILKKINSLFAISCDIIIGFPGEKEENFKETINFLEEIKPMRIHLFTFSPREKTIFASELINKSLLKKRYKYLKDLSKKWIQAYKEKFLGEKLFMVAESFKKDLTFGYTENYLYTAVEGKLSLGEIYLVKVKKIEENFILVDLC